MPGPNDYHLDPKKGEGLQPGLGKDEPSDDERARVNERSRVAMETVNRAREEIKVEAALLEVKGKEQAGREKEQNEREKDLAKRERALAAREKELAGAEK